VTGRRCSPKLLFKGPAGVNYWEVAADGQRFLIPVPGGEISRAPYEAILNWTSTLNR
jgi:hypothetical protein